MNAIAQSKPSGGALVTAEQAEAIRTALKSSLYPGASDESVDMVLAYCRAGGLDPMTKPVHIVPMWIPEKKLNGQVVRRGQMQDVVMPGIELYRTKAHRTGEYVGQDEAEFGDTLVMVLGNVEVRFPEWCKVTVYKLVQGLRVAYSAKAFWLESYAPQGKDTDAPNAMWRKRPFGQLEKCAEALALRKAFPEAVGAQPTAEEMEGKEVIDSTATVVATQPAAPPAAPQLPPPYPDELFATNLPTWREAIAAGKKSADEIIAKVETRGRLTADQKRQIKREEEKPAPNPDFPLPGDDTQDDSSTTEESE